MSITNRARQAAAQARGAGLPVHLAFDGEAARVTVRDDKGLHVMHVSASDGLIHEHVTHHGDAEIAERVRRIGERNR